MLLSGRETKIMRHNSAVWTKERRFINSSRRPLQTPPLQPPKAKVKTSVVKPVLKDQKYRIVLKKNVFAKDNKPNNSNNIG